MKSWCSEKKPMAVAALVIAAFGAAGATRAGDVAKSTDFYELTIATGEQNDVRTATITVVGRGVYHCNTQYPWKLTVTEKGVEKIYKKADAKEFSEKGVSFVVPYADAVKAALKLSMCSAEQCKMETVPLTWK